VIQRFVSISNDGWQPHGDCSDEEPAQRCAKRLWDWMRVEPPLQASKDDFESTSDKSRDYSKQRE